MQLTPIPVKAEFCFPRFLIHWRNIYLIVFVTSNRDKMNSGGTERSSRALQ